MSDQPGRLDAILPEVYDELRRLARRALDRERSSHTLQPTALVHEAYLKLAADPKLQLHGRLHLLSLAARAMRQILVDHARVRGAHKRGSNPLQVTLSEGLLDQTPSAFDMVALDEALTRLGEIDEQQVRIIELRFLVGLTVEEAADLLGLSTATVKRETATAGAWLYRELRGRNL
ncbi:MAG TPA: ECF-type sigma factor [Thermoanaerobaculia bacterium]|nr:ECF-type sigma factor [Thermoanaerobaculia bacterium]